MKSDKKLSVWEVFHSKINCPDCDLSMKGIYLVSHLANRHSWPTERIREYIDQDEVVDA